MIKQYKPYTYFIKWTKHNKWYYGSETAELTKIANPVNFWSEYFTSSKAVSEFRRVHGEPDVIKIGRIFTNGTDAQRWEAKFLQRVDAVNHPNSLNGHNSDGLAYKAKIVSEATRKKQSEYRKGRPKSEEWKKNMSESRKRYFESDKGQEWKKVLANKWKDDNPCKTGHTAWNAGKKCPQISKSLKERNMTHKWTDEQRAARSEQSKRMWAEGKFDNRPKPTAETVQKIADAVRGFKQSDHQKQRVSETMKGKPKSDAQREKQSEVMMAKRHETKQCEHCNFVGYGSTFTRYHGDRCKRNQTQQAA